LENSSGVEADALAIDNSVTTEKNLEKQISRDEEPSKSVYLVIFKSGETAENLFKKQTKITWVILE